MNTWVYVVLILLLFVASAYYLYPKQEVNPQTEPTIQYTKPIGPTQEPPYKLPSKLIEVSNG